MSLTPTPIRTTTVPYRPEALVGMSTREAYGAKLVPPALLTSIMYLSLT